MGEGINGSADLGGQEDVFSTRQEKQTHVLTMNLRDISLDFLKLFFFLAIRLHEHFKSLYKKWLIWGQAEANKIPQFHNGICFRIFHFHSFWVCLFECPIYGRYFMMAPHQPCLSEIQLIHIVVCVSLSPFNVMHFGNISHLGSIPECTGWLARSVF